MQRWWKDMERWWKLRKDFSRMKEKGSTSWWWVNVRKADFRFNLLSEQFFASTHSSPIPILANAGRWDLQHEELCLWHGKNFMRRGTSSVRSSHPCLHPSTLPHFASYLLKKTPLHWPYWPLILLNFKNVSWSIWYHLSLCLAFDVASPCYLHHLASSCLYILLAYSCLLTSSQSLGQKNSAAEKSAERSGASAKNDRSDRFQSLSQIFTSLQRQCLTTFSLDLPLVIVGCHSHHHVTSCDIMWHLDIFQPPFCMPISELHQLFTVLVDPI